MAYASPSFFLDMFHAFIWQMCTSFMLKSNMSFSGGLGTSSFGSNHNKLCNLLESNGISNSILNICTTLEALPELLSSSFE